MVSKVVRTIVLSHLWVYHNRSVHTIPIQTHRDDQSMFQDFTLQPHTYQPRWNSDLNLSHSGLPQLQPGFSALKWSGWKVLAAKLRSPDLTLRRCWRKTFWVYTSFRKSSKIYDMIWFLSQFLAQIHETLVSPLDMGETVGFSFQALSRCGNSRTWEPPGHLPSQQSSWFDWFFCHTAVWNYTSRHVTLSCSSSVRW